LQVNLTFAEEVKIYTNFRNPPNGGFLSKIIVCCFMRRAHGIL